MAKKRTGKLTHSEHGYSVGIHPVAVGAVLQVKGEKASGTVRLRAERMVLEGGIEPNYMQNRAWIPLAHLIDRVVTLHV